MRVLSVNRATVMIYPHHKINTLGKRGAYITTLAIDHSYNRYLPPPITLTQSGGHLLYITPCTNGIGYQVGS